MSVDIKYKDELLVSLPANSPATLQCAGKIAKSDIVLVFNSAGSITYKGRLTAVLAGQTVTLACSGKLMTDNIVVMCEDEGWTKGLAFTLSSDGKSYTCTGIGTATDRNIVIGRSHNGLPVTKIGSNAFADCIDINSVTIPDRITSIGDGAFSGCYKLVEVINHSALDITAGSEDYGGVAYYAIEVHTGESKIVNYEDFLFYTYDGVNYLFDYIGSDSTLVLPKNYNGETYVIYNYAFYYCDTIVKVEIPESVTSIGNDAFKGCEKIEKVEIPKSVTTIGSNAFKDCSSLSKVDIPDSVTSIGNNAFSGCTNIEKAEIPDSVTNIEDEAFKGCEGLTSVAIPLGVTSIGSNAFKDCINLTSVVIPSSVESIGDNAFYNCSSLPRITIPKNITSIGDYAFYNCTSLEEVYYGDEREAWQKVVVGTGNDCLTNATIYYNMLMEFYIYNDIIYKSSGVIQYPNEKTLYYAIPHMSWYEWVHSEYNTDGYYIDSYADRVEIVNNSHLGYYDRIDTYRKSDGETRIVNGGTDIINPTEFEYFRQDSRN